MVDGVEELFEREKQSLTYRRINPVHPIDIYVGYDSDGHKSLVIVGSKKVEHFVCSKAIQLSIAQKANKEYQLAFTLKEEGLGNLFYKLCDDIIESTQGITKENVLKFTINRWNYWRRMFEQSRSNLLSTQEVMGLVGELVFLKEYMIPKYGVETSILAWRGPEGGYKDFEIKDTWYEVKTISKGSHSIKISSLEQLDSDLCGQLVVIKTTKTSPTVNKSIQVNAYIKEIYNELIDTYIQGIFMQKLINMGYRYEEIYDQQSYCIDELKGYMVDETFPKIVREHLALGIEKVSYEISVAYLEASGKEGIHCGINRI